VILTTNFADPNLRSNIRKW